MMTVMSVASWNDDCSDDDNEDKDDDDEYTYPQWITTGFPLFS